MTADLRPAQYHFWLPTWFDALSTRLSKPELNRRRTAAPIFLAWNWIDARILAALYYGVQISEIDVIEMQGPADRLSPFHVWRGKGGDLCCSVDGFFERPAMTYEPVLYEALQPVLERAKAGLDVGVADTDAETKRLAKVVKAARPRRRKRR